MKQTFDNALCFIAEWFDPEPQVVRKFLFKFDDQNYVEMKELNKGYFLKRTNVRHISRRDLFVGATIHLLSRDLKLVNYGDDYTRKTLEEEMEKCVIVLNRHGGSEVEDTIAALESKQLTIVDMLSTEKYVAIEVRGRNARAETNALFESSAGSSSSLISWSQALDDVENLRRKYLKDRTINLSKESYGEETTCCIIKPHAIRDRLVGLILKDLVSFHGCNYYRIQSFNLDRDCASEFFEVYKECGPLYKEMVNELCSGSCIVLIVKSSVEKFREIAGPFDVDISKVLFPTSIRAKFGKSRIENAIHCTDRLEEKELEIKYFFDILVNI
jgi:nucleoside-diphosphate kinase